MEQDADHTKVVAAFFYQSDPFGKKSGHLSALAKYYSHVGVIFMNNAQYSKTAIYYNLCIALEKYISVKSTILVRTYVLAALKKIETITIGTPLSKFAFDAELFS
ncbi:hypothetical protein H7U22_19615 [Pedobacter sp. CCM 8938]|uniref:Uncharacterized protein n=3 Tax=Pedobacter fastidiosus TaxID=2765361 RepID=A0ABR7KX42_9SPHI|nr:hypothetical protein [Pedobacter fastidiosus]MBC6112637.1 hypothetical protein [Pedobacter fastidiosus]